MQDRAAGCIQILDMHSSNIGGGSRGLFSAIRSVEILLEQVDRQWLSRGFETRVEPGGDRKRSDQSYLNRLGVPWRIRALMNRGATMESSVPGY